jgi:hypothetical protein
MRKLFLILCVLLDVFNSAVGQDADPKLTIPSSPAFSILNFEPSAVMRPTSNRALASDVLNSFDNNGALLMNLGLEISPYWLKSHPKLTREEFLQPSDLGQVVLQSLSFSAASMKDSATGDRKLGAGFRFKLINGKPLDELYAAEAELDQVQILSSTIGAIRRFALQGRILNRKAALQKIEAALKAAKVKEATIKQFLDEARIISVNYADTPSEVVKFMEKLMEYQTDTNGDLVSRVYELTGKRMGFVLELAGASGFNSSHDNNLERAGFWVNASNYVSPQDLFTLTGRYMFQNRDSAIANFDMGLSYLRQTETFNVSVEGLLRWYRAEVPDINQGGEEIKVLIKDLTYRLAVQGSFMVTNGISVNLSIGKDFDSPFASSSSFFSILGFNYSLFRKQVVVPGK